VRAFYAGPCPPASYREGSELDGQRSRLGKIDTTGLGVILMDYLLTKEWVPEAEVADSIKVHNKLIRRALKYLEREHFLMSEHRRETRISARKDAVRGVLAAHAEAERDPEDIAAEEEALLRPHTISYYAVDFPRLFDVVQLRLHHMRRVLKDELDSKEVLAQYRCPTDWCGKQYDSLEASWLVRPDGEMHCDMCDAVLRPVLASGEAGDDVARRERRATISSRLARMDTQLKDLTQMVSALRNSVPPFYGSLRDWAVQQQKLLQNGDSRGGGPGGVGGRGPSGGGMMHGRLADAAGSTNYWQDTMVEVNLAGSSEADGGGGGGGDAAGGCAGGDDVKTAVKLPPWMLRKDGEHVDAAAAAGPSVGSAADAKGALDEDERKKAYVQAYLAMLAQQQAAKEESVRSGLSAAPAATPGSAAAAREGVAGGADGAAADGGTTPPSKRVRTDDGEPSSLAPPSDDEDGVMWEDAGVAVAAVSEGAGGGDDTGGEPKLPDASPLTGGVDDDVDWEDI